MADGSMPSIEELVQGVFQDEQGLKQLLSCWRTM
jgi:hypothetical protein